MFRNQLGKNSLLANRTTGNQKRVGAPPGLVLEVIRDSAITDCLVGVSCLGSTGSIAAIMYEFTLVAEMIVNLEEIAPRKMTSKHSQTWGDDNELSHLSISTNATRYIKWGQSSF